MIKVNRIIWVTVIFCFLAFFIYVSYNSWHSHRKFYDLNLSNKIEEFRKTPQGFFELRLNSKWVYLWTDGACIDTIQSGDSIFKQSNSFEITIKRKNENYRPYKYNCSN
jgi:hypothetical protein